MKLTVFVHDNVFHILIFVFHPNKVVYKSANCCTGAKIIPFAPEESEPRIKGKFDVRLPK